MHKIQLDPDLVARLTQARGGRLHVIETLDPARTAHIIVDMQNGFVEQGAPVEVPVAREIVPNVNRISQAIRTAGGANYFVQFTTPIGDLDSWSTFYGRFTQDIAKGHQDAFTPGAHIIGSSGPRSMSTALPTARSRRSASAPSSPTPAISTPSCAPAASTR
jgi:hypothetical protein